MAWPDHRAACEANALAEARTKLAPTETRTLMPGVEMECTTPGGGGTIKIFVQDKLSGKRHEFEYPDDTPLHKVKQDLRDAERPRSRGRVDIRLRCSFLEDLASTPRPRRGSSAD